MNSEQFAILGYVVALSVLMAETISLLLTNRALDRRDNQARRSSGHSAD